VSCRQVSNARQVATSAAAAAAAAPAKLRGRTPPQQPLDLAGWHQRQVMTGTHQSCDPDETDPTKLGEIGGHRSTPDNALKVEIIALELLTEICRNSSARGGLRTVSSNKFSPTRIDLYANEVDCLSDDHQAIMLEISKKLYVLSSIQRRHSSWQK